MRKYAIMNTLTLTELRHWIAIAHISFTRNRIRRSNDGARVWTASCERVRVWIRIKRWNMRTRKIERIVSNNGFILIRLLLLLWRASLLDRLTLLDRTVVWPILPRSRSRFIWWQSVPPPPRTRSLSLCNVYYISTALITIIITIMF